MSNYYTGQASHIGSHRNLLADLSKVDIGTPGTIDAIVVPTINPQRVGPAITLARALGCVIVLLCSTSSQVQEIRTGCSLPPNALLLEVPPGYNHPLFDFEWRILEKYTDIALKRNIGLTLARLCGWRTILFLDDDIRGMTASMIRKAAALTEWFPVVGFQIPWFPDNSVVCHANRASGGEQSTFIGVNATIVDTFREVTYFPDMYNEDWMYLRDAVAAGLVAVAGELRQLPYDPFSRNAATEEFGDLIAEALVRALHSGLDVTSLPFWVDAIEKRSRFIDEVAARIHGREKEEPVPDRDRILLRLAEAKERLQEIRPTDCLSFYRTWRENVDIWRRQLGSLPTSLTAQQAAAYLHLSGA
ncbi:hypothetical protein ACQPZP_08030 [Spirillospora sp. CA-142024]|uniref:hypothetical protein n=1 Tax=Spirillospora sp. CA-142024 TaxID=3240036 RepID=UPI003D90A6CF